MRVDRRCQGHGRYAVQCRRTGNPTSIDDGPWAFFCHDHEGQRRAWERRYYFEMGLLTARAAV